MATLFFSDIVRIFSRLLRSCLQSKIKLNKLYDLYLNGFHSCLLCALWIRYGNMGCIFEFINIWILRTVTKLTVSRQISLKLKQKGVKACLNNCRLGVTTRFYLVLSNLFIPKRPLLSFIIYINNKCAFFTENLPHRFCSLQTLFSSFTRYINIYSNVSPLMLSNNVKFNVTLHLVTLFDLRFLLRTTDLLQL